MGGHHPHHLVVWGGHCPEGWPTRLLVTTCTKHLWLGGSSLVAPVTHTHIHTHTHTHTRHTFGCHGHCYEKNNGLFLNNEVL